jgi:hypothetical protein
MRTLILRPLAVCTGAAVREVISQAVAEAVAEAGLVDEAADAAVGAGEVVFGGGAVGPIAGGLLFGGLGVRCWKEGSE